MVPITLLMFIACCRLMCRYFCDTPQVHLTAMDGGNAEKCLEHFLPCGLYDFPITSLLNSQFDIPISRSKSITSRYLTLSRKVTAASALRNLSL